MYILSATLIWIAWNRFSPIERFDEPFQGYPNLVFIYTIYFGLVEGIMKVVQAQQQKHDESEKEILDQILKETHNQTKVIHNLVKIHLVLGKRTLEILESYSRKREEEDESQHNDERPEEPGETISKYTEGSKD